MSTLRELDSDGIYGLETPAVEEKNLRGNYSGEKKLEDSADRTPPEDWLERLKDEYSGQHEGESLPPGCDPDRFAIAILTMNEEQSVECLNGINNNLHNDYTFDSVQAVRMRELLGGSEACGLERSEWSYQVCKMAGIFHNWSAYLEVRACTLPYDDIDEPCETIRAYIVGFFWVIVMTAGDTCEFDRILTWGLSSAQADKLPSLRSSSARYLYSQSSRSIALCPYGSKYRNDPTEVELYRWWPSLRTQPWDAVECEGAAFHHHHLLRRLIHR